MADERVEAALRWIALPTPLPPEGQAERFEVGDLGLLVCNAEGTPYVVHDECPHVRTSMAGALIRGTILECPLHGGQMDVRDGSPVAMPIRRPGTCYAVRDDGEAGWKVGLPPDVIDSRAT